MPKYKATIIVCPSGRFEFVGSVPGALAYIRRDGTRPTDDEIDCDLRRPPQFRRLKVRTFLSVEGAVSAAEEIGFRDFEILPSLKKTAN